MSQCDVSAKHLGKLGDEVLGTGKYLAYAGSSHIGRCGQHFVLDVDTYVGGTAGTNATAEAFGDT